MNALDRERLESARAKLSSPDTALQLTDAEVTVLQTFGTTRMMQLWETNCEKALKPAPPKPQRRGVSDDAIATGIVRTVKAATAPLIAKIGALEAELAAVKDRLLLVEAGSKADAHDR